MVATPDQVMEKLNQIENRLNKPMVGSAAHSEHKEVECPNCKHNLCTNCGQEVFAEESEEETEDDEDEESE